VAFLDELWNDGAPLRRGVHDCTGKRREPYDLGPGMREFAQRELKYRPNVEDLYAVWAYAQYADRWDRVMSDIGGVREIVTDFAQGRKPFEHDGTNDDAEHLNGRIAGVLAAARIFRYASEEDDAEAAFALLAELATGRVHHERADRRLIRPTRVASKGLHQAKVPRYVGLVPEAAGLLREHAGRSLRRNVGALMRGLPLWYQAYGERMIGGENYISPPHLSRGIFAAWADGCQASVDSLAGKLDQPWGKADLYYIEKLTAILRRCNAKGSPVGQGVGSPNDVVCDRVHAFYYPWYSNPETDGAYAHWSMGQFVKQGRAKQYPGGEDIAANFYPALGCYSSHSEGDVAAHMKMLRRAGVGVLCTSWWGIGDYTDRVVAKLLDGAAAHGIKVCFHIEPFRGRNAATTREAIVYIIDQYGSHPAFHRHGPGRGRPVFYLYDSYLTPAKEWATVLSPAGQNSIRRTRYDAIVIGLWVKQHEEAFMLAGGFDGFYTYFATEGFTYGSTPANWPRLAQWAKRHGKSFIPCVGPGYDDTRIRPWNGENRRSRENGAYYDREFKAALAVGPDIVGVTSFNEWHEGTQIEPAVPKQISGYRYEDYLPRPPEYYLDRTRFWVERYMSSRVQ
jgi:glycoprotein endo-alpha-1,2-mannosidase